MGGSDEAAKGMHTALRLGTDSVPPKTFEDLIKEICYDDEGKQIFNFEGAIVDKDKSKRKLRRNKDNVVVDDKGNTIDKINVKKLESFFASKDSVRLIYFDETGLLDKAKVLFLEELARKFNLFIIGSGDTLQNKAEHKGATDGIEDTIYNRTPSLTISMRAEKNGNFKNVEIVKNLLRKTKQIIESEDPSYGISTYDRIIGDVINDVKNNGGGLKLIHSDTDLAGHQLIKSGLALDIAKKMLSLIDQIKETDTTGADHKLAIVVDVLPSDESTTDNKKKKEAIEQKRNLYRNTFGDRVGKDVIIIDAKEVQGKEFDYVLVDKDFDVTHKFYAVQDFYTMMTRAKRGAAIVDDLNIIGNIFDTAPDESASESVLGSTPEEKASIFADYIAWRMGLMDDVPEYSGSISTTSTPPPSTPSTPTPPPPPTPAPGTGSEPEGPSIPPPVTEIVIMGTEENVDVNNMSDEDRLAYYTERMTKRGGYYAGLLTKRQNVLNTNHNSAINFDEFLSRLKNLADTSFEEKNPLSLLHGKIEDDNRFAHRVFIATVARAILNNDAPEGRRNYINAAGEYLTLQLKKMDIDPGNIVVDLANSFTDPDNGYFFCKDGLIYYTFESDKTRYAIPITVHYGGDSMDNRIYPQLRFKKETGAIPVTSFGEIMSPTESVVSEIDGIAGDASGTPQVGVVALNDTILGKSKQHFNLGKSREAW